MFTVNADQYPVMQQFHEKDLLAMPNDVITFLALRCIRLKLARNTIRPRLCEL